MKLKHILISAAILVLSGLSVTAQNTDIELVTKHVYTLADDALLGRGFGSESGAEAAEYIKGEFIEAGIEPLNGSYYHDFVHRSGILNINGRNVVGLITGSDPDLKDEYIVIGAHYDHLGWEFEDGDTVVYNGADDNATGVSAVIELGRYFAAHQSDLKRSVVLIAFDGEESGLIGSKRFVKDTVISHDAMKAMFSIDMIGMYEKHGGMELGGIELLSNYDVFMDRGTAASLVIIKSTDAVLQNRTDTAPFGKVGIPASYVNTGIRESEYHKPTDDADIIDYDGMVLIIDFMTEMVMGMSQAEELNPSNVMAGITESGGMKRLQVGIKVNTGSTYFDYPDSYYQSKTIFAVSTGLFLELRLAQWLTLQPEVLYETKGGQQAGGALRTHAVTTPVSLLFTSPDAQNNGVRGYFQAGGYYSYAFAGSMGGTALDFNTLYNNQTYGLILGGGMQIFNVRIGYTARHSFVDFLQTPGPDGNTRLKGSYFTIGWAF